MSKQSQIVEHFSRFQTWVVFLGGHVSFLWDKSPGAETQSGVCQGVLSCKGDALLYSEDSTTSHHSGRTGGPGFLRHHQHWQGITKSRVAQADFKLII